MIWCEHLGTQYEYEVIENNVGRPRQRWSGSFVQFCPFCGKARPKELSLAERFVGQVDSVGRWIDVDTAKKLAEIAREYYEGKK